MIVIYAFLALCAFGLFLWFFHDVFKTKPSTFDAELDRLNKALDEITASVANQNRALENRIQVLEAIITSPGDLEEKIRALDE